MHYVYILRSESDPVRHYVRSTGDLQARLTRHNSAAVTHTSKYLPSRLKTYLAFEDQAQALAFETYLKTASGRAFARKRL